MSYAQCAIYKEKSLGDYKGTVNHKHHGIVNNLVAERVDFNALKYVFVIENVNFHNGPYAADS